MSHICPAMRLNRPTERHRITEGRVDGPHVWLTCSCGENWWAATGRVISAGHPEPDSDLTLFADPDVLLASLEKRVAALEAERKAKPKWEPMCQCGGHASHCVGSR